MAVTSIVHALLALSLLGHSPTSPPASSGLPGISVQLIGEASAAPKSESQALENQLVDSLQPSFIPPQQKAASATQLSELLGENSSSRPQQAGQPGAEDKGWRVTGDPSSQVSMVLASSRRSAVDPKTGLPACWRRPARVLPVKVLAAVDSRGVMVGPPHFPTSTPAPSKAEILRAMSGCAPYVVAATRGPFDVYELDFSREQDWIRKLGPRMFE